MTIYRHPPYPSRFRDGSGMLAGWVWGAICIIAVVGIIAVIATIAVAADRSACHTAAKGLHFGYKYSIINGCRYVTPDGIVPADNYRVLDR